MFYRPTQLILYDTVLEFLRLERLLYVLLNSAFTSPPLHLRDRPPDD